MKLIVGLGNPGAQYKYTRHNMGFRIIEELAHRWHIALRPPDGLSRWGKGRFGNQDIVLAQPYTYMNLSGRAVIRLLSRFHLTPEDAVIIHDDLDLPPGRLKFVAQGGPGGHRGISSIITTLGTNAFLRLKIGIGHPRWGEPVEAYVLNSCYHDERDIHQEMLGRAADAVEVYLTAGLSQAMSQFHGVGQPHASAPPHGLPDDSKPSP